MWTSRKWRSNIDSITVVSIKMGHRVPGKEVHRWQYQWLTLRLLKLGDTFRILYPKSEKVRRAHTINNPQDDLKSASLLYIDRHHCGKLRLTVFKSIRLTCNFNRKYFCFCLAIGWKYFAIGVKKDYVVDFKN